ncbi:MAG: accessory gene regulator B family protein [Clostridia bacterium]
MMQKIAECITAFLQSHHAIRLEDREVYVYGCDIAVYTFLSTLGLLILGAGFGYLLETSVLIVIFYLNQTMGGTQQGENLLLPL